MSELQEIQVKLEQALTRIGQLEQKMQAVEERLPRWKYLIARPHSWRKQFYLKDRNMTVGQLMSTVLANRYTLEKASENLNLPLDALREAVAYYEENKVLIQSEAAEERRFLAEKGCPLEPTDLPR